MYAGKPIIGIVGGIGSGKSYVSRLFGELGCLVLSADEQVRDAYRDERVKTALREWWGPRVFTEAGEVDRAAVAAKVFGDTDQRRRLERLLHPMVAEARDRAMAAAANDPQVLAYVWDTPLLFEAGLADACDAIVFVDAPQAVRLQRVRHSRGWDEADLARRENLQWPLDKKKSLSDHVVSNTPDAADAREQVRALLPRIIAAVAAKAVTDDAPDQAPGGSRIGHRNRPRPADGSAPTERG